jgi:hypothetical protein
MVQQRICYEKSERQSQPLTWNCYFLFISAAGYYLLSYAPPDSAFDKKNQNKYHKIQVNFVYNAKTLWVKKPNLQFKYGILKDGLNFSTQAPESIGLDNLDAQGRIPIVSASYLIPIWRRAIIF